MLEKFRIKYELIPKGVWREAGELHFKIAERGSKILEGGEASIQVDSIDHRIGIKPTYIKMDVEGAEYQALLGAKNTISAYKPKLAISVYHEPEDIWELPVLIHKLNCEYRFYLRHYSFFEVETVLYAV